MAINWGTWEFIALGLVMGIVFGFAFEKSRVFEPGVIVRQFQLRNFLMLKVMSIAIITSIAVIYYMHTYVGVAFAIKPTFYNANIIGGALLGVGIALAGACPGTVLAQVGAGYKDALFTLLGGIVAAKTYGVHKDFFDQYIIGEKQGKIQIFDQIGISYPMFAILFVSVLLAIWVILEIKQSWESEVGNNLDGIN